MNSNRTMKYSRFSNYRDLLGEDSIVYIYGNNKECAIQQLEIVKGICKKKNIPIKKVYMDMNCNNYIKNKLELKKMINENNNKNILISNTSILTRNITEMCDLKNMCNSKNIEFYDLSSDKFILNDFNKISDSLRQIMLDKKGSDKQVQRKLDVLYIEPNKLPIKKTINNTLEEKQKLVGGLIEYTYLPDCDDVVLIYNEESKALNLPYNRYIGQNIIAGNFFIVGDDPEFGEDRSLTGEQIEKYTKMFGKESIEKTKDTINRIVENKYKEYEL